MTSPEAAHDLAAECARLRHALDAKTREAESLSAELAETNTGVVALYSELDTQADQLRAAEERIRHAEERARIAEAKSAMLAANALKLETEASHKTSPAEVAALREENEAAALLLAQVLNEVNALADAAERTA